MNHTPLFLFLACLACADRGTNADTDTDTDTDADADADTDPDSDTDVDTDPPEPLPVFDLDFEADLPPAVVPTDCDATPSQGYEPLGPVGGTFGPTFIRCLTGGTLVVTLEGLPAHSALSVDFLFAAIDSLDGEGVFPAGDYFRVDLDGTTIFREAFANATPSQVQTYETAIPGIVLARRVDLGFAGPGSFYTDSAYDMALEPAFEELAHTASTAVLTFTLEGAGVQTLDDESWAIDNLVVTVTP